MIIYGIRAPMDVLRSHVRHIRPVWLMEELGAPYEVHYLDPEKDEESSPEFLAVNPFGKVPALKDGDFTLFESAAICTYLAEKHNRLVPPPRSAARAKYDQWMCFALAMVEPHAVRMLAADVFYEGEPEAPVMRSLARENLDGNLPGLERHLAQRDHLLGAEFNACDILMTASLRFLNHTDVLKAYPALTAYVERTTARPAFGRALEKQ